MNIFHQKPLLYDKHAHSLHDLQKIFLCFIFLCFLSEPVFTILPVNQNKFRLTKSKRVIKNREFSNEK